MVTQLKLVRQYDFQLKTSYQEDDFDITLNTDTDVYDIGDHLLLTLRKRAFENRDWFPLIDGNVLDKLSGGVSRDVASDSQNAQSSIMGYFDVSHPSQKQTLGSHHVGRTSTFTEKHPEEWSMCLPFIRLISDHYRSVCPEEFVVQKNECEKVEPDLLITETVFSTASVNINLATDTHTDSGNFAEGMTCISILGNDDYEGGFLGFPRYRVLLKVRPGDIVCMKSCEPHCNTPIYAVTSNAKRVSIVCYLRQNMSRFHTRHCVENEVFFLEGALPPQQVTPKEKKKVSEIKRNRPSSILMLQADGQEVCRFPNTYDAARFVLNHRPEAGDVKNVASKIQRAIKTGIKAYNHLWQASEDTVKNTSESVTNIVLHRRGHLMDTGESKILKMRMNPPMKVQFIKQKDEARGNYFCIPEIFGAGKGPQTKQHSDNVKFLHILFAYIKITGRTDIEFEELAEELAADPEQLKMLDSIFHLSGRAALNVVNARLKEIGELPPPGYFTQKYSYSHTSG